VGIGVGVVVGAGVGVIVDKDVGVDVGVIDRYHRSITYIL